MEKKDIINYVLNSPQNTNPAILSQMIDEVSSGEEGEGEVWATSIYDEYENPHTSIDMDISSEEIHCSDGVTTTKTYNEWKNFYNQLDGKYSAKLKGYFTDFPTTEVDLYYQGKSGWDCSYQDDYDDNYSYYGMFSMSGDDPYEISYTKLCYEGVIDQTHIEVPPTKLELIVYKK